MRIYKPREFGKLVNRSVKTLQVWDTKGTLVAYRTPTNRRYYTHDQYLEYIGQKANETKLRVVYYRVSSVGQKEDMERQRAALEAFCISSGRAVDLWVKDVGSGLNYKRQGFIGLMEMVETGQVQEIVIAHKDRLVRFGYEWFEMFCERHGTVLTVINSESLSPEEEMVQDLLSIVHVFSSRLYGLRRYKKQIRQIVEEQSEA